MGIEPLVKPNPPGALERQVISSMSVKSEIAQTPLQEIQDKARRFIEREGLKKETGWQQIQTDEASYSKLRSALRNDDFEAVKDNYEALLKNRKPSDIKKEMRIWVSSGFTGQRSNEHKFRNSLTPAEEAIYDKAKDEKRDLKDKFNDWLDAQP